LPILITIPNLEEQIFCDNFYIGNVEFDVHEWEPHFNMAFNPPQFKKWLALRVPPYQTWNKTKITRLVQRFGYPLQIYPYGVQAGNFKEIRVLIVGEHPIDIHRQIIFKEDNFTMIIDVYIHRYQAVIQDNNPPPHHPPGREPSGWQR
jgi:hypothetical protein